MCYSIRSYIIFMRIKICFFLWLDDPDKKESNIYTLDRSSLRSIELEIPIFILFFFF